MGYVYTIMHALSSIILLYPNLYPQGMLRNLPLVGSVWSWFSPASPSTPQGRQFDLSSGMCICIPVKSIIIEPDGWWSLHNRLIW